MNEASAAADAIINVGRPADDGLSLWFFLPHCCWNARLIAVDPRRIDSGACGALATTAAPGQAHGLRSIYSGLVSGQPMARDFAEGPSR